MSSSEAISQFRSPYPLVPYEIIEDYRGPDRVMSKLESFNYEIVHRSPGATLDTANIVIILERHDDPFYQEFYGLILNRFYNPRPEDPVNSDVLFLEAPGGSDLWFHILKDVKRVSKLTMKNRVLGWGNSDFYENVRAPFHKKRKPIIENALKATYRLKYERLSDQEKTDDEETVKSACPSLTSINDYKELACKAYELLTEELRSTANEAFLVAQKELIKQIDIYYEENKTLFFTCGKSHGHLRSLKKAKYQISSSVIAGGVEELYKSLEGRNFIIIYPKQPKMPHSERLRLLGIDLTPPPPPPTAVQATMNFIRSFF